MTTAVLPPAGRLHGLDALRGIALLLGVVLHAAMSYFPMPLWVVADTDNSPWALAVFFAIHLFRMTVFFMIAGLFANMMLERRGWVGFVRDRAVRILGPLAAFWLPALVSIIAVLIWMAAIRNGGTIPTGGPPPPAMTAGNVPLTHLWFLYALLIFYAAFLAIRAVAGALDKRGVLARVSDRLAGVMVGPWTPLILAAPLALAFLLDPSWIPFFGIPTPDHGLIPNPVALVGFGLAFGFGVLLDRRRDLLQRIARLWPVFTVVGVGAGIGAFVLTSGFAPSLEPLADPARKALAAPVYAVAVYASALAAMAMVLRFMAGHSPVRRYLADASYWVYIVHLPLVMVGQVLVLDFTWPWFAKLGVVVAGALAVSLLSYELLIRHSFMGRWLNGRRVPWRRRPTSQPLAVPAE